jgi:hypothetical protein
MSFFDGGKAWFVGSGETEKIFKIHAQEEKKKEKCFCCCALSEWHSVPVALSISL